MLSQDDTSRSRTLKSDLARKKVTGFAGGQHMWSDGPLSGPAASTAFSCLMLSAMTGHP